jgi:1-acyl-sn-glycerol-3-phosphate acyltransferase
VKPQVYKDPRPADYFTRFHTRTRTRRPDWVYELVRVVLTPVLLLFYRTRCIDSDKVPLEGPAVVTPNHFSFFDHFFVAVYLRRKVHFMAKSQLFKRPLQFIFTHGGVFPVLRGRRDQEAFETALRESHPEDVDPQLVQAAPPDQLFLGLNRYLEKRAEAAA